MSADVTAWVRALAADFESRGDFATASDLLALCTAYAQVTAERDAALEGLASIRKLDLSGETGKGWKADIAMQGAALEMFTASMADVFKDKGGPNYVEASLRDVRDGTLYFCIVGPKRGKTPHELRQQAEHALATLRADLAAQVEGMGVIRLPHGYTPSVLVSRDEVLTLLRGPHAD